MIFKTIFWDLGKRETNQKNLHLGPYSWKTFFLTIPYARKDHSLTNLPACFSYHNCTVVAGQPTNHSPNLWAWFHFFYIFTCTNLLHIWRWGGVGGILINKNRTFSKNKRKGIGGDFYNLLTLNNLLFVIFYKCWMLLHNFKENQS